MNQQQQPQLTPHTQTLFQPRSGDAWTAQEIEDLFALPFNDLLYMAQTVHRANFDPNAIQRSVLMSIKTGGCSENCGYCSQSARHDTGLKREPLVETSAVIEAAKAAKEKGASRFCMGAAWRGPKERDLDRVLDMVREVKAMGLETCVTLGKLSPEQAEQLSEAGLDYYNHNLDTAESYYEKVVTTHTLDDRYETIKGVRKAGMKVCSGGIIGMGETRNERAALIAQLAGLDPQPESVPVNQLVRVPGTPLEHAPDIDPFEVVRTIACARIVLPKSYVRLSAGRGEMSDELQALSFLAGANSIFYGDTLLTTENAGVDRDELLFARLGLKAV